MRPWRPSTSRSRLAGESHAGLASSHESHADRRATELGRRSPGPGARSTSAKGKIIGAARCRIQARVKSVALAAPIIRNDVSLSPPIVRGITPSDGAPGFPRSSATPARPHPSTEDKLKIESAAIAGFPLTADGGRALFSRIHLKTARYRPSASKAGIFPCVPCPTVPDSPRTSLYIILRLSALYPMIP